MQKVIRLITSIMVVLTISILFLLVFNGLGGTKKSEGYYRLDTDWDVRVEDILYENVNLSEFSFPLTQRGDKVIMERTLPEKMAEGTLMQFYVSHAAIEVCVEDELIYEYGTDLYEQDELLGYGYHFIHIPYGSAGKEIQISLCVSEKNAFGNLNEPVIDDGAHMMRNFAIERRAAIAVILFLVVFGIIFLLAIIFYNFEGADFYRLLNLALFALNIGIWNLCNYDVITLFTYNIRVKALVEFSTLYAAPTFLLGYFFEEAVKDGKLQRYLYFIIYVLQILFLLVTTVLQVTDIAHFPDMLIYSHVLIGIIAIYLVSILIKDIVHKKQNHMVLMFGLLVVVLFCAWDMIRYNVQLYIDGFEGGYFKNYTYLGVFIFILSLIVDFTQRTGNNLYIVARNETLEKMAYTDELTGLLNRRRCEELYDEIDHNGFSYAVIAFDLNELKRVNDTLGHDAGDAYLKEFSKVLKKAFDGCGDVIRTGGDEFLTIVKNPVKEEILNRIEKMQRLIEKVNQSHKEWNMSTAYGICDSSEESINNIREANKVADTRMYEKKRQMKGIAR